MRENSKVRRSNGGQESNRVKRESSRVTPSRGGNGRYKVIAQRQRQSSQDRSITSQAFSAPRLIRRRGGEGKGNGRKRAIRGKHVAQGEEEASHRELRQQEESAPSEGTDCFTAIFCRVQPCLQKLAHHDSQCAGDPSCVDIAHNLREDFTGLYWWGDPIRRGQPHAALAWGQPRQSGSLLHTFWPLRLLVSRGPSRRRKLGVSGGPGLSWAIRAVLGYPGCPG